jgi:predicted RNA-binding protein Jag
MKDMNGLKKDSAAIVEDMLATLGIAATVTVAERGERGFSLELVAADPGQVIGRKGSTLESLEQLLNRILKKKAAVAGIEEIPYVELNVPSYDKHEDQAGDQGDDRRDDRRREERGGYRRDDRRPPRQDHGGEPHGRKNPDPENDLELQRLQRLAQDKAKEVKKWGKPLSVGPYNAAERRAIHLALEGDTQVATRSEETETPGLKIILIAPADVSSRS